MDDFPELSEVIGTNAATRQEEAMDAMEQEATAEGGTT